MIKITKDQTGKVKRQSTKYPAIEKIIKELSNIKIEYDAMRTKRKLLADKLVDFHQETGFVTFSLPGVARIACQYGSRNVTDLELLKRNLRTEGVSEKTIAMAFRGITTKKKNEKPSIYVYSVK